jgi:hypothetical protein
MRRILGECRIGGFWDRSRRFRRRTTQSKGGALDMKRQEFSARLLTTMPAFLWFLSLSAAAFASGAGGRGNEQEFGISLFSFVKPLGPLPWAARW